MNYHQFTNDELVTNFRTSEDPLVRHLLERIASLADELEEARQEVESVTSDLEWCDDCEVKDLQLGDRDEEIAHLRAHLSAIVEACELNNTLPTIRKIATDGLKVSGP